MELSFEYRDGVLRVDIRGRETAEETRESIAAAFAEIERTGARSVLVVVRDSRPIFKVEAYGLSGALERLRAIPGLRVATVGEDRELHASHQYIELLAAQRDAPYRTFRSEAEALAWLRAPREG